ncbi:CotH kinase family protein [Phocaeicola dorei]|uniref:CotH kinase family protein n=1 Tax=Phocaeicola dorei TaxID=357276 RepID=UPI001F198123|nr:CotH kinase family protein [Phocaeicola dorei]MCE8447347.1 CotH kinase family protein [Phocaeicola dorei]
MTEEEKKELVQDVVNQIKTDSQSVDELEAVSTLDGVVSLPAMRGETVVSAPLKLLSKPAEDAAAVAKASAAAADASAKKADTAASTAKAAAQTANDAAGKATDAAQKTNAAVAKAESVEAEYKETALAARNGATARFDGLVEGVEIRLVSCPQIDGVYYDTVNKSFCGKNGDIYCNNWPGADMYMNDVRTEVLKDKAYVCGGVVYVWSDEEENLVEISGSGGGNTYNVTEQVPLESGYYTLETAIAAVEGKARAKGRCITYETAQGKWETKQFKGTNIESWGQAASWEDFGGDGTVKSVTLNGKKLEPGEDGNVAITISETEVDESLNVSSTNPVQNAAVAAKLMEIEASTVLGMNAELSDDGSSVRLTLTNKSGAEIASADIPAGSGGGGGDASTTKIVLDAAVSKTIIKEGDSAMLTWTYDHQYSSGDEKGTSTGQKATVSIEMKRGATVMYADTQHDVSKGTYTLDLTKYLLLGTTDIYVRATTTDPTTGKTQTRQSYVSVKAVTLALSSSFNIAECVAKGGYGVSEAVSIPFAVSGSGDKTVTLYLDGHQWDSQTVKRSGTTNGSFSLSMSGVSIGRHTVQIVAEMEASAELTLKSESIYFDILKAGHNAPYIGTKLTFGDGRIFADDHLTPTIETGQYEQVRFDFVAYDPTTTPATVGVWRDGIRTQTVSVPRTTLVYTNRFLEQGDVAMVLKCGTTEYKLNVKVTESGIDLSEATAGLVLKLTAAGRSNAESEPAEWRYNDVQTVFEGFDWQSNGWTGDALKLTNGANVEIGYKPFGNDATTTGATYEMELTCTNVTDRRGTVVDCMTGGVGFRLTTQEALMRTGAGSEVGTKFASGMTLKIAFVVQEKKASRLMTLYVNGILCGAKQYASTDSLLQAEPTNIRITSESADVEVRNLRVYNRALGDDEELANYMVDRPTSDEMVVLFEKNQVMDDEGTDVDIDKLRAMGKSVMRIVGDVNLVNQTNNKKFEVPVDIYFYSAYGKEYDFIIYQCGLRIQGTSSTTYPRKNYRIYFSRSTKYGTKLYVNGVEVADFKYSFKPGARPIDIFCLKADFSDSSSTHNTGAVRIVNDIWKRCGWLTPPQMAYKGNYDVRIGVDGFPIDLFYDNNGTGENVYLGKYNFNNEKSGSGIIYGFEGIEGFNDEAALKGGRNKCICLEFLNNSETLCLFGTSNMDTFDDALEFRFKADDTWATAHEDDKAAVKRLWEWIYSCKGNPTKFLNEYAEYFGNDSPFAWYLITDYFMAVDNRAKNMMLVTWDGKIWYFIPYDMDTVFGERNDSVLKYDYTITWETMDESIGSYAFAGHDSVLWELVRGCPDKLREVADKLRSTMSLEYVLKVFNEEMMGNWCERIYNKDGIYKYIKPLTEGVTTADGTTSHYDYLYALQGSRYAHRTYTIQNRFALLDSQYVCGTYRKDSFAAYFGYKFGSDNRKIRITASERYFFGYGYTSGTPHESAVLAEDTGSQVELTLDTDLIVNDPQYIYGASRIMGLDLTDVSHAILQTLNLNNCSALRTLDVSCGQTQTTLNALLVNGCRNLRTLNMTGLKSGSFTGIDLSNNTKLETLKAGKTALTGVNFAQGAPLTSVTLPATLQTLELRYLGKLTTSGLTLEGTSNINRLVVDNCPGVDWQTLHARCGNVKYLRVTGIDMEGDGSLLASLMQTGGVDENGGNVESCRLVGTYRLTRYKDDEEYEALQQHFPELNIEQPEYTMLERAETIADDACISNLDNETGYKYGNDYKPSGHVAAILKNRHRVLAKVTKKATPRNVTIAGVDTVMNNLDGEMTCYPLDDADSNKYADGSPAKLDGSEGDWMMLEPFYWSKGVNDYLNGRNYDCYSFRDRAHMPRVPEATVMTLEDIKRTQGGYTNGKKVMSGRDTINNAFSNDSSYSVCMVSVDGYKRVRFPSVPGTNLVGSVFVDKTGAVLQSIVVSTLSNKFEAGMYLISDVPEGAVALYFSILNTAEFDKVVLSNSEKIEDMEPDWVPNDEHLCGVAGSSVVGTKLRSCITGGSTTANMTWMDFHYYSVQRGMQQIDPLMHWRIANLSYAKYGRKNMQEQCGAGSHSNTRTTGGTASRGMQDTVGYEEAKGINPNVTNSLVDNLVHQYAWYVEKDEYGAAKVTQVNNICCLGYEDIYGHKYDMMDRVDIPNTSGNVGKWRIWMPDGTIMMVKGTTNGDSWITAVAHGKWMAVVPVGAVSGSSSTYYSDKYWFSSALVRVVYRGCSDAYANGGVSNANASDDASNANADVGSRLAFRGKIVRAQSVAAYKAIVEVA